jgi:hypothetical protein
MIRLFNDEAGQWADVVIHCIRCSSKVRHCLAEQILIDHPNHFEEYLLDCTSVQVNLPLKSNIFIDYLYYFDS